MEKKHRSPSYPQMSIKEAIERVGLLYKAIGGHPTSREVIAKGLGYSGLNGTSATAISTLTKYGLIDGRGEEVKVSDRAMAILHPHSKEEQLEALRSAALAPDLFQELASKFPGGAPHGELLRNYLLRNKFSPQAVDAAILAYKETIEFVGGFLGDYDSASQSTKDAQPMQSSQPIITPTKTPSHSQRFDDLEEVAGVTFKGVGVVKIVANPELDTKRVIEMAREALDSIEKKLKEQDAKEDKTT